MKQDLRALRMKAGMTALEVGRRARIAELRVYALERNRFPPHPDEAERLGRVLEFDPRALWPNVFLTES